MKLVTGTVVTLVILSIFVYGVLYLWGIQLFSPQNFIKSLMTLGIIIVCAPIITVTVSFFFKDNDKDYDMSKGVVAHPKEQL